MTIGIRSADLRSMSEAQRDEVARVLASGVPQPGNRMSLQARISQLEMRYEMDSEEMQRRVSAGEMEETAEVSRWLVLLTIGRDRDGALR